MTPTPGPAADVLVEMLADAHELPPWLASGHARRYAQRLGAGDLTVWLQDYEQLVLIPLPDDAAGRAVLKATSIDGSLPGRAFMTSAPVAVVDEGGCRLFLPLLDGADRVGVVEIVLPASPVPDRDLWMRFAALLTDLIVTKGAHTDVYFRARRRHDMTLAAEMQWHLLPPLTVFDPRVALAGTIEPAYAVGGDVFDYAINHETAHLAIFDAMGHGLDASLMATVAVGAYRHSRRAGVPVEDMYTLIDAAFSQQFGTERFATAQIANLDLPTGTLTLVNAGHPSPLHVRGHRVIGTLTGPRTLPIGLGGAAPELVVAHLEPGDRLLLYSDGVTEARRDDDTYDEAHLVTDIEHVLGTDMPLPEVARRLNHRLTEWRGGPPADDATLLLVEWRGRHLPPLTGEDRQSR